MSAHVIRIFSDLHYADGMSRLRELSQLRPLLDGADRAIVNGDAFDSQAIANPADVVSELKAFFAENLSETTFITGNHDPDISDLHELSLVGDRIWITHGDVLFDDVAPWSRVRPEICRRLDLHGSHLSATERAHIETKLRLFRQICLKLPRHRNVADRGLLNRLNRLLHSLLPPNQAFAILKVWREAPRLARELAAQQRPAARFVLLGHTHFEGVWPQRDGRTIINTGSFCPPRGGHLVEVGAGRLYVRKIDRRNNEFRIGQTLAEFAL